MPSKENAKPEAQAELDRRERKMQIADRALYEIGIQLQSQRMELYQANQQTDQNPTEKSWLRNEQEMRNRKIVQEVVKSQAFGNSGTSNPRGRK